MLQSFQLAAIVREGRETSLLRVPMLRALQNALAEEWEAQFADLQDDVDEVEFDAGYTPEEGERFCLEDYDAPEWMVDETSQTIQHLEPVHQHEDALDSIKGIAAFARRGGDEIVLFQNFNRSHVIRPHRSLFLENNTYRNVERPGLTLDSKLAAVYYPNSRKLVFRNFRTTNTFLPLAAFYEEASEEQIREVLNHARLTADDVDALAVGANQWFRKRWAMLRDSGILDQYTAQQIEQHAQGYGLNIVRRGNRILFPTDRQEGKRLLQFLNEQLFRGPITDRLFETNSRREAD